MNADFLNLKKEVGMKLPYILPNGLNWRLDFVKPNEEDNGYYHFYECEYKNGKTKSYSGFSSPDYNYFKSNLHDWIKMYIKD